MKIGKTINKVILKNKERSLTMSSPLDLTDNLQEPPGTEKHFKQYDGDIINNIQIKGPVSSKQQEKQKERGRGNFKSNLQIKVDLTITFKNPNVQSC